MHLMNARLQAAPSLSLVQLSVHRGTKLTASRLLLKQAKTKNMRKQSSMLKFVRKKGNKETGG